MIKPYRMKAFQDFLKIKLTNLTIQLISKWLWIQLCFAALNDQIR